MPSKRLAVVLVAMVLLSGCSMLPGGGGGGDDAQPAGPDYHELTFYSHTNGASYNGTLAVKKDGETVHETAIAGDGTGTYLNVTRFDEPGPYTVVVNTSLPDPGGETMHRTFTVNGTLGNATAVTMNFQDPHVTSYRLGGNASGELVLDRRIPEHTQYRIRVTHQGETVLDGTFETETTQPEAVADLRGTGIYRVKVQGIEDEWTNRTLVLTEAGAKIGVHANSPPDVAVYGPDENVPDDP